MNDILELGLVELGKAIKKFYDSWAQFKNKRIRITTKSYSTGQYQCKETWNTIIEGTIDSIQEYPPGIFLKNVNKRLLYESITINVMQKEPLIFTEEPIEPRTYEKLFISFHEINEIEFIDTSKD